jgi:hypothetical protein
MVNSDFYSYRDVLRHLRENVQWKRPELWHNHNWLHHENAPTHMSLKTTESVTNNNMVIVPHSPYSLDLAPCNFAVFQIENETEGTTFWNSVLTSKGNRKQYSTALRKMASTVLLKHGKKWWDRRIHFQGDYFEGDGSQNWVS